MRRVEALVEIGVGVAHDNAVDGVAERRDVFCQVRDQDTVGFKRCYSGAIQRQTEVRGNEVRDEIHGIVFGIAQRLIGH